MTRKFDTLATDFVLYLKVSSLRQRSKQDLWNGTENKIRLKRPAYG